MSPTTAAPAPQSLLRPMVAVLKWGVLAAAVGIPLGMLLGYLIAGGPGVWGALMGLGISFVFFTITVGVSIPTARMQPQWLGVVVLGSWLAKIIGLIVVLAVLRSQDFYDRPVFFVSLLVGTFGYLAMEAVVVSRTKVLYVETDFAPKAGS